MSTFDTDETFDRAMRDRHRQALQQVSSPTRARLAADRHAATRGDAMPALGWRVGAALGGFAAVAFAITLGLNFNQSANPDGGLQPGAPGAGDMLAVIASNAPLVTALDQDPDFYAWLESSDAQLMAME